MIGACTWPFSHDQLDNIITANVNAGTLDGNLQDSEVQSRCISTKLALNLKTGLPDLR